MKKNIFLFIFLVLPFLTQIHPGINQVLEITALARAQEDQKESDIVLVLDNSGSMKKNDPDFLARDVVTGSFIGLGDNSRLGMIIFDSRAKVVVDLIETRLGARASILNSVDNIDYRGLYSDTPAAIERAIYELKTNGREDSQKIIILLTDGIVDTGEKGRDIEKSRWLKEELTQECKKAGIRIIGIAFTENADFSLIQTLAIKTDGEYFRAYRAEDIHPIFEKIRELISKQAVKEEPSAPPAIEPEETKPSVVKATPPSPQVEVTAQTSSEQIQVKEAPLQKEIPPAKSDLPMPLIILAIFVLLGIIVIVIFYSKRSRDLKMADIAEGSPSPSGIPRAMLIDINNITGNKSIALDKKINMIGRDPNNDVVIDKDTISSFHATIEYRDGFFYIEDQRSMNKTILDGEEIAPHSPRRIKSGDEIMFNIYKFRFMLPDLIPSGKTTVDFHGTSGETSISRRPETPAQEIPAIPKAILVDVKNITGKKTIRLTKKINKIGRGPGNDIEIAKDSISGLHATIEYRDGFFYIEDQRSKNKTSLGDEEIEPNSPRKLKSGDEILFDIYKFIFLLEYEPPSGDTGESTIELS